MRFFNSAIGLKIIETFTRGTIGFLSVDRIKKLYVIKNIKKFKNNNIEQLISFISEKKHKLDSGDIDLNDILQSYLSNNPIPIKKTRIEKLIEKHESSIVELKSSFSKALENKIPSDILEHKNSNYLCLFK